MQLLARLMDHVLARRNERITLMAATSGDTGGAAVEAFAGRRNIDLFVLFPEGRVSPFQQRQMTTTGAANVHAARRPGHLRRLPGDGEGAPSTTATSAAGSPSPASTRSTGRGSSRRSSTTSPPPSPSARRRLPVAFSVPTGNFGDVFAGYAAKRMGLPVARLIVATNVNDILARTLATGRYEIRDVHATTSPSMDIQVSSNFERLLFEAYGRDAAAVRAPHGRSRRGPRLHHRRGAARSDPRRISPPACADETRRRRDHRRDLARDRLPARSAYRRRHRRRPAVPASRARRWLRSRPPIRRSSPPRSRRPPAAHPALPEGFADLMTGKEVLHASSPTISARFEDYLLAHAGAVKNEV